MRVNKPEASECLPAQRIVFESGNKYPFGVANNDMGNIPGPVDKNAYLTVNFIGELREISCEFRGY